MATNFSVLGVPISDISEQEFYEFVRGHIASRIPAYVVTPNLNHARLASLDSDFAQALAGADLRLCDSRLLFAAGRMCGQQLPSVLSGSDITPELLDIARREGWRVFLFGSNESILQILQDRFPECVVGCCSPPWHARIWELEEANRQYVAKIREAAPDLLFVALGPIKQELWAEKFHRQCDVPMTLCIGASLDFVAGKIKRAPVAVRKIGCEWLWRIIQEPRRLLGRYCLDALFLASKIWQALWRQVGGGAAQAGERRVPRDALELPAKLPETE